MGSEIMEGMMARPNPNAPLGQGGRFAAVEAAAARSGARNPGAVAAAAGRKKYGAAKMARMAAAGRRKGRSKSKGKKSGTTTAYQGGSSFRSY